MAIVLGDNRYGKAETRLVRVVRDTARHEVRDLTVSSSLRGDFAAAHVEGDQANVDGRPHDHTFVRSGAETRTAVVTAYDGGEHVLTGLTGLVLLKSTGS